MNPRYLPSTATDDGPPWRQSLYAFLAEKERRSGSKRTVEGYARMLWPFFERTGSPERIKPAHVLAWAHGIGASGREPSSTTVGARIACLSSYTASCAGWRSWRATRATPWNGRGPSRRRPVD